MKSIVFLFLILLNSKLNSQGGWIEQQPPPGVYDLYKVFALSEDVAFAVGDSGKIIKTTNGGEIWEIIYTPDSTYITLNSIFFIDSFYGWAVGGKTILNTEDGGKKWFLHTFSEQLMLALKAVYFINADTGWITGGGYGSLFKTVDGGKTWEIKGTPASYSYINDIYFADSKNGFAVASEAGWGIMRHGYYLTTSDGGESWDCYTSENLYSLSFIDRNIGWLSGGRCLYFTNDGGKNWESKILDYSLNSLCFVNEFQGWTIGRNFIINTTDGGDSWKMQDSLYSPSTTLSSIHFCNENTGWVVGKQWKQSMGKANAFIVKTTNGGVMNLEYTENQKPQKFYLYQNYPNPFNPVTKIKYSIPVGSPLSRGGRGVLVTLKIYDALGNEVATLVNEEKPAGSYEVTWNADGLSSGVYFYQLKANSYVKTKKMILLR